MCISVPAFLKTRSVEMGEGDQTAFWISRRTGMIKQPNNQNETKVTGQIWAFPVIWKILQFEAGRETTLPLSCGVL